MFQPSGLPPKQGLYDPQFEHDACGVGFVVNIKGKKSHEIVRQAITILVNLSHRGACGCEANTGDGAGILFQLPHEFFKKVCDFALPAPGEYGVGMVFLPHDEADRHNCEQRLEAIIKAEGQQVLGWRTVPTDNKSLGHTAIIGEPFIRQIFVGQASCLSTDKQDACPTGVDDLAFERKLYVIRKVAESQIRYARTGGQPNDKFYFASLSSRTIVYKGMLMSEQVEEYYPDLADTTVDSALAIVHSRFSTNTFPSWERAHPYRYMIHNGEINTLRGNVNWMVARQSMFKSELFGDDLPKVLPVINADGSDSGIFDNCLEFLSLSGRSLPLVMMMMIPEPWANHESMSDEKKAFYEYHSCLMEPWDGPASMAFTDGIMVGAVLDRNGLRPSRYYVTKDDLVIMASEVGVLDIPPEQILYKRRLQPGRMFLIDTHEGRIIDDAELKHTMATAHPYRAWLNKYVVHLEDLPTPLIQGVPSVGLVELQQTFGYTFESLRILMAPMARDSIEPVGSMGNDTPLAVLSNKPQLLYNYFKQLFAQVTNPPIDSIREEIVTDSGVMLGTELNLLETLPESCRQINIKSPILTNETMAKLKGLGHELRQAIPADSSAAYFKSLVLPILFKVAEGSVGLEQTLTQLCQQAKEAIHGGINIIILSDRGVSREDAPIPALLAVGAMHHFLIRAGLRTQVGLVLESGEPREVHHFALLLGYGATAVNPYLAYEILGDMIQQGLLPNITPEKAVYQYIKACVKGVVKTMSKMGISSVQSYSGAQIFEAIGLNQAVIDKYFTWTPSRIGGIGLEEIYKEVQMRHHHAFPERQFNGKMLSSGGDYQWRADGELHLFNPLTIQKLQHSARTNDYTVYQEYANLVNDQSERLYTLRGLLDFKFAAAPIPLEEVESVDSICRRFKTGAMSYGSISQEAHEALAIAMNRLKGRSNTGEGGEDPARFIPDANGDSRRSSIKQVASGRFGVTSEYLVNADELQIKMAQGAKPGEGGQLPGRKIYPWIAKVRHSTPGVGLISPPPHHDIYSIEDLGELIHDLKNANQQARISVKLVSEVGVGTVAAGVAKGHADVILISGYDGGTGASPHSSVKHAGLPWELGLAETHQTLVLNNLRSRVALETDGQLKTGRDVAMAALLGAEEFGFATAPLVTLGCLMMRVCHLDTCPVGVATQNPDLRKKFMGKPDYVVNFMHFVAQELREIMAKLGFRTIDEMVGRTDKLEPRKAITHWKAKGLDFSNILYQPPAPPEVGRYCQISQDHGLDKALDNQVLLELCRPALDNGTPVKATLPIKNTHRVVGTILGSEVTRRYGAKGLPEDTIRLHFNGSAGQSFGAFVPQGITLSLDGDANDYFGKGLSGGKLIVYPPTKSTFVPEENIIIGNVALYGATSGEAYVRGVAGERFCVRNSGANTVVEGVGDHACEYMTGGRVVVLGQTGRNFAAGMTGGIAYVLDEAGDFSSRCNQQMVTLEKLTDEAEIKEVETLIRNQAKYTHSAVAQRILAEWSNFVPKFVKVLPTDYQRMLGLIKEAIELGSSRQEAAMIAFELNKSDMARVSGN